MYSYAKYGCNVVSSFCPEKRDDKLQARSCKSFWKIFRFAKTLCENIP